MKCWNCGQHVFQSPFCANCGAALPNPTAREALITARLGELRAETHLLEAQLRRIQEGPQVPAGGVSLAPSTEQPVVDPVVAASPARHAPAALSGLTPALVVTLAGVVVLAAASLVASHEHPALISLARSTRLISLIFESLAAVALTYFLKTRRPKLADAFGVLTWAGVLSLILLLSVNPATGLRPDTWTYVTPFGLGGLGLLLSGKDIAITRYVSLGTVIFGAVHLASYLSAGIASHSVWQGLLVLLGINITAAFTADLSIKDFQTKGQPVDVAFYGLGSVGLWFAAWSAQLPPASGSWTTALSIVAMATLAVPLVASARRWGMKKESLLLAQWFLIAAAMVVLADVVAYVSGLALVADFSSNGGVGDWPTVIVGLTAGAMSALVWRRTQWRLASGVIMGVGLTFPAMTLIQEFFLGVSGQLRPGELHNPWYVTSVCVVMFNAPVFLIGRKVLRGPWRQLLRDGSIALGLLSALSIAYNFIPWRDALVVTTWVALLAAIVTYVLSDWFRAQAPLHVVSPLAYLSAAFVSVLVNHYHSAHALCGVTLLGEWRIDRFMIDLSFTVLVLMGLVTSWRRRDSYLAAFGWGVVSPAVVGIALTLPSYRMAFEIALLAWATFGVLAASYRPLARHWVSDVSLPGVVVGSTIALLDTVAVMAAHDQRAMLLATASGLLLLFALIRRIGVIFDVRALTGGAAVLGAYWALGGSRVQWPLFWEVLLGIVMVGLLRGVRSGDQEEWHEWGAGLLLTAIPLVNSVISSSGETWGYGAVVIAVATLVVGYLRPRRAFWDVGVLSLGVVSLRHHSSITWQIVTVSLAVVIVLVTLQRRWTRPALGQLSDLIALGTASWVWITFLNYSLRPEVSVRTLVLSYVGLATLALAVRLRAVFDNSLVLAAALAVALVWTHAFALIHGPAYYLAVGSLALLGLMWQVDTPRRSSWREWGPALSFAIIPANYAALTGHGVLRASLTLALSLVLLLWGIAKKLRAMFDVATATFVLLSVARLTQVVSDKARWAAAIAIGIALIANGIWRETRQRSVSASATSWYRSLR